MSIQQKSSIESMNMYAEILAELNSWQVVPSCVGSILLVQMPCIYTPFGATIATSSTEKDMAAKNPRAATVLGFFVPFFKVEF